MMWLLIPGSDRPAARRVVGRIDQILGYPRQHAAGEIARNGVASQAVPALVIRTETQMDIRIHSTTAGLLALRGVIAINVNSVVDALRGRYFDIGDGVRKLLRDIITERGWEVRATLPGLEENWTRVATRDGEAGSADGVPIPEGSE